MKTPIWGMMDHVVQLNKSYIKCSINPIQKRKAMLPNVKHMNLYKWILLPKMNTKWQKGKRDWRFLQFYESLYNIFFDDSCRFLFVVVSVCFRSGLCPFPVCSRYCLGQTVCLLTVALWYAEPNTVYFWSDTITIETKTGYILGKFFTAFQSRREWTCFLTDMVPWVA